MFLLLFFIGCSAQTVLKYDVPIDFDYVQDVVKALEKKGVEILDIRRSLLEGLFNNRYDSVWINTNKGILNAMYVPDADPREIKIVFIESGVVLKQHKHFLDRDLQVGLGMDNEIYFIQTEKFFIETKSKDIHTALKDFK